MKFLVLFTFLFSISPARAQVQLWSCEVECGSVSNEPFTRRSKPGGLAAVKRAKDQSPTWSKVKIWPLGYQFKLSKLPQVGAASPSSNGYLCEAGGDTAEHAMKALEGRITGKDQSIMVRRCNECTLQSLNEANCLELKSGRVVAYPVLKSRMNPEAEKVQPDSTATIAQ